MNNRQRRGLKVSATFLAIGAALAASSSAQAVTFDWGDWSGSWDNTISYGLSIRGEDPDPRLLGRGNGGTGYAILTDDGDLNWESGDIFSNIIKGTSEIGIDNGQFGGFVRIKYWYDFELENGGQPHGHVNNNYVPGAKLDDNDFADYAQFSGLALLDAFVYGSFELGDSPLDLRLGRQVVNWGESLFIQGINILNPIDVSALRRPGREIKEALLPVSLIYGNMGLPFGFSVEAFYQFKWEETVIDGCGTYWSDVDFAAKGCNQLLAPDSFEAAPGVLVYPPEAVVQQLFNTRKDPFTDEPKDSGQWGIAIRNYVEAIDTEFGLFYQRLHSRTPVLNSVLDTDGIAAGSVLGGAPVFSYYQVAYPEDIDIWGLSFATNIGVVALAGEVSLKQDLPIAVNGTTQLTGHLGMFRTQGSICALPDPTVTPVGQWAGRACDMWTSYWAQGGYFNPDARAIGLGYDRFDVTQVQTNATYLWEQGLGADRVSFVGEVAWISVDNLPSIDVMPYGRNPIFGAPQTGIGGPSDEGFMTSNSWGYRLAAVAEYSNVFAGVALSPVISWSHDVDGTSPPPTFIDGRKALSVALNANYLTKYRASVSYTWFTGGYANTLSDRDFFSFTVSMDF